MNTMKLKELFRDVQLRMAALILAEQTYKVIENPGDDELYAQETGMRKLAYGIFNNDALTLMYGHYCRRLGQPLPKPGETVLYYDPLDDHRPKPAKVIESKDSTTLEQPKMIKCECEGQVLKLQDQHIYRLLYW